MRITRRTLLASLTLRAAEDLRTAFARMYDFDFPAAHAIVDRYIAATPNDPMGYAARGAAHLFSELDRLGILATEFFTDDKRIADKKKPQPDPNIRNAFYWATTQARERVDKILAGDHHDKNALMAASATYGMLTDYAAFVEKKQLSSLTTAKQAQSYAVRLLAIDSSYGDAYLTTGITEYLLGSLPFFFKWFVKFEQAKGSKEQAVTNLKIVASKGRYFGPFARILLAVVALREKRKSEARVWLEGLVKDYPANPLLRKELEKLQKGKH